MCSVLIELIYFFNVIMRLLLNIKKKHKTNSVSINKCSKKIKQVPHKSTYASKAIVSKVNNVYYIIRMNLLSRNQIDNRKLCSITLFKNNTDKKMLQSTAILSRNYHEDTSRKFRPVFIGSQMSKALIMYNDTNYDIVMHRHEIKNISNMFTSFCYKYMIFLFNNVSEKKNNPQLDPISNSVPNTLTYPNIVKNNVFRNNSAMMNNSIKLRPSILGSSFVCLSTSLTKSHSFIVIKRSMQSTRRIIAKAMQTPINTPIRPYASHRVHTPKPTTSSNDSLNNNPALVFKRKNKNGTVYQHPERVKDLCNIDGCDGKICIGLCSKKTESRSVGHFTHSDTQPNTKKVSEDDFDSNGKPLFEKSYAEPHKTSGESVDLIEDARRTAKLQEMLQNKKKDDDEN